MQYSAEQLNYFRLCYVGFNLVPEGLRQIFRQEWNFRYKVPLGGEWQDRPHNGLDFYNKEGKRSRTKNARYLATIQNGNTAEWDCTCLFFAILFSDSIGTTLGPAIHKDVNDLRQVRNDIAHICEAKLTDAEFQSYMARVLHSFMSLGLPVKDIEGVRKETSFPTAELQSLTSHVESLKQELKRKEVHLQQTQNTLQRKEKEVEALTQEIASKVEPFCILTSKPSHEVIKRSNDVSRLIKKMKDLEDRSQGTVSTIYISGTPGCGKSQLARQLGEEFYCKRSHDIHGVTFVATLNAESIETLADSYITLGKHLGITEYTLTNLETSKIRENPKETIQHLKILIVPKIRTFSKWLIIADNVVELNAVRSFLPQTVSNEWGHGQVLITTQDSSTIPRKAPHTFHESFSKGMEEEDAVKLLKEVSGVSDEAEHAKNVAKVLEYQPLALAAAAFYVHTVVTNGSPGYSWTNYLEVLRQGQREATEQLLASESSAYSKTMTTAIQMALKRAAETDEVLRQTLSFFSLCSSELLPVEAVVKFVEARIQARLPEELIKAKMLKSSLILFSPAEKEGSECLRLHNTVHEVLKQEATRSLEPTEKIQNLATAMKIFEHLLDFEKANFKRTGHSCAMLNKLTSHCKALLKGIKCDFTCPESTLLKELTSFIALERVVSWLCSTANTCNRLSDVTSASWISELACNLVKSVSNTLEGTLLKAQAFSIRGDVCNSIGKHQEAKELYGDALTIYQTTYGKLHADVEISYTKLAGVYCSTGDNSKAKELYENALAIQKAIYDANNASAAYTFNRLGRVYQQMGQYSHAKDLFEKALVIRKTIYGEDDTNVAASLNNLGGVYIRIGKYNEAKRLHENALTIQTKIHGVEHADVADSYSNLGMVYEYIGDYKKAKEFHSKALAIQKRVYGETHTAVASSYNNLGSVYRLTGEYNKAKDLCEKALRIKKIICGGEHAIVAVSYNSLGLLHLSTGETSQAKEFYEKALTIKRKIFSEEHPDVATGYNNLGGVYYSINQYNKAKELHEKALMIQIKNYGDEHAAVAASYNNLGLVHHSIGEFNQAKQFYRKALIIQKIVYGENHVEVATSYANLGRLYQTTGEYKEAKDLHEKALEIRLKVFNEKNSHVVRSYNHLASVFNCVGDYYKAKFLIDKALMVQKTIYDEFEEHDDVATSYDILGYAYAGMGDFNKAKELHRKALMIQKKVHGEKHAHVATTYNNLGLVYQKTGECSEAKYFHQKALSILKGIYGEQHADVAKGYQNLAHVYYRIGENNQAKELQEKALKIQERICGEESDGVATNPLNLEAIKTAMENTVKPKSSKKSTDESEQ